MVDLLIWRRPIVITPYASTTNLGIIHSVSYPSNNNGNYYRRNANSMVYHNGRIWVGGGHARNDGPGPDTGATVTPRYIDTTNDSFVSAEYTNTSQTAKEFQHPHIIDGELYFDDIDSKETVDANYFTLDIDNKLARTRVRTTRNHCYYTHKSRRDPDRWFSGHGWATGGSNTHSAFTSYTLNQIPISVGDNTASNWFGSRGYSIYEFGPSETSRLIAVQMVYAYAAGQGSFDNYLEDPTTEEIIEATSPVYEWNWGSNTWTGRTRFIYSGLDREFSHPWVAPTVEDNTMLTIGAWMFPMKLRRIDDNTYIGIFGYSTISGKFFSPGKHFYLVNEYGTINYNGYGGVYYITLDTEKPFAAANGNTFLKCTRVLDNPQETGRQWDYKFYNGALYVLTETMNHEARIYKNGRLIQKITNIPCCPRCFEIVNDNVYIGLSSEDRDSFWEIIDTISSSAGTIIKLPLAE